MTVLNKTSCSCTNLTVRGCLDQFGYYLLFKTEPKQELSFIFFPEGSALWDIV